MDFYMFMRKAEFSGVRGRAHLWEGVVSIRGQGWLTPILLDEQEVLSCRSKPAKGRSPPGQFLPCSCSSQETAHFSQVDLETVLLASCTEGFPPCDQNPVVQEGVARAPPINRALSVALKTIIRPDLSVAARMCLSPASSPPSPAPG